MDIYNSRELLVVRLIVGQMEANCYLIIDKKTKKTIILDPGEEAEYIENNIRDKNCIPEMIISTHGHFDHNGAVLTLQLVYQIPFLISQKDVFLFTSFRKSAVLFTGTDLGPPPTPSGYLEKNSIINFGENRLLVIETPGHTPGSICLFAKNEGLLFTGDTIFAEGQVGRTDFSYSSAKDHKTSLKKIFKLLDNTIIYPGHKDSSTVKKEKEHQS